MVCNNLCPTPSKHAQASLRAVAELGDEACGLSHVLSVGSRFHSKNNMNLELRAFRRHSKAEVPRDLGLETPYDTAQRTLLLITADVLAHLVSKI